MSKKKSFTGNTMTLKDFHGGSIPSDVPLPSAPGMVVRPIDRTGYDRQNAWGNPMGRSDHRLRPSSSGSMRNLDDKTPFLASIGHIGKNFEEDERKPLDGSSSPRRTVSDEGIRASSMRLEPKGEVGRFVGQQGLEQVVAAQGAVRARSYSGRVVDAGHLGVAVAVGSRPLSGNSGGSGLVPNAWGAKKEAVSASDVVVSSSRTEQSTFSKFAQASALDQISSGRWQTKPLNRQVDVEVIKQSESPKSLYGRGHDSFSVVNFVGEKEYNGTALVRHVERGLAVGEGVRRSLKGMSGVDGVHSPVPLDVKEEMSVLYTKEGQPAHRDSKHRSLEVQMPSEMSERPKLKLLPRTKPLDAPEPAAVEYEQDFQWPAGASQPGNCGNIHGNASCGKPEPNNLEASDLKPAVSSNEAGGRPVERPKLNLKPRSQPLDRLEGNAERERKAVFGGARPREMVLKLRSVDDVINSHEEVQNPRRIKSDVPRTEIEPVHANTVQHGEKIKNIPIDHGSGRSNGKREQRIDVQKSDAQKMNWRNENRRNSRDVENHPRQDRQPSPETWRKPVEQPGASDSNSSVRHCGKAVSAAELAQTFSRSASGSKSIDQFSGKRGIPAHTQVPFSRLAGPPTRPQINGY